MTRILCWLFLMLLLSCQDNFDEWNDTDQRRIVFDISTVNFYDDLLNVSGNTFIKGTPSSLEPSHRIRISCYCYDSDDNLVQQCYTLVQGFGTESIMLQHLQKNQNYRFVFIADVVKYDESVDFYELWFQLGVQDVNSMYLFCVQPDSIPANNVVRYKTLLAKPENNHLQIQMDPLTVNGYVVLSNLSNVEMVSGYYIYNESFFIETMKGKKRSAQAFSFLPKGRDQLIVPITTAAISDIISFKLKRVALSREDSTYFQIENPQNSAFSVEIDCATLKPKPCVYY